MPLTDWSERVEPIHSAISDAPHSIETIAVAIRSCSDNQRHLGLVYRDNSNELRLLELILHQLVNDPWNSSGFMWFVPDLDPLEMIFLRGQANTIADANGRYALYGFSDPRECFDERTGMFLSGSKVGLTCASFVLAVFEFAKVQLIDYESWQFRSDDIEWQIWILDYKETRWVPETDISELRHAEIGNRRYRPEEVAAACDLFPPTVAFTAAKTRAEEILIGLDELDTPD